MEATQDQGPPREAGPGKKWIKATVVVDGHDTEEWVEVDAGEALAWPARETMRLLNKDIVRIDGADKVTGRARYTHDVRLPGMVYARLLLSPHPAATAEVDVLPAFDIEGVHEARPLGEGGASTVEVGYLGQAVAAVVADTPELAEDGLRAIVVDWRAKPFAVTREQSLAEGAPLVSANGNVRVDRSSGEREEAEVALEACDVVVEATYSVPIQHHVCLETHGVVADVRGGEATVYTSTQATHGVHQQAAGALGMERGDVTALVEHMGGGFGSKFSLGLEGAVACQLSKDLGLPVHLMLTRSDEFLMAGNRSGCVQTLRGGATKSGEFVALISSVDRLGGVGRGSHPGQPYVYTPAVHFTEVRSVFTHMDGSRAFRAPGHPQASFGIESMMDELAYGLELDTLEFRKRNLPEETADTYRRQLDQVADVVGWKEHPNKSDYDRSKSAVKTGIGFGVATWGGGGRASCEVDVKIGRDGSVTVLSGTQDLGTGTRTYVAAIVAEELGLELDQVRARIGSSNYGMANASGGSTTTASLAPAVKHAAHNARVDLFARIAEQLELDPSELSAVGGDVRASNGHTLGWEEACWLLPPDGLTARGTWQHQLAGRGVQGAQAAKVEVDTLTGAVRVLQIACVQNIGLALNPLATRSQINGGIIQALSYGLLEERVLDEDLGVLLTGNLDDYKIAGCQEIPEIVAIIDETDERGVIGVGEPVIVPGHSAIANAIHNACGVRLRELPMTPDKVLTGLGGVR
jgi:xanthine dehydrogenase YagR molybdenum-binding subunit